jgi:beta-N-acetylglucosaminidase
MLTVYCIALITYALLDSNDVNAMELFHTYVQDLTSANTADVVIVPIQFPEEFTSEITVVEPSISETESTTVESITEEETETTTITQWVPSRFTSIEKRGDITLDDMEKVIQHYRRKNDKTYFEAEYFIKASDISGLDPVYIFAHAAVESGYGEHHAGKYNYFGIGCFDGLGSSKAYKFDSVEHTMRYSPNGNHNYCTSTRWEYDIESIMINSYNVIRS